MSDDPIGTGPLSDPPPPRRSRLPDEHEADEIFEAVSGVLRERGARVPSSTYRFQFNREFTFRDALAQVDYLATLGVGDVYASPFFAARPDSMHGYDIVDHNRLNPSIGTREDLDTLCARLRERQMGLVLDTVPNHMGVGTGVNAWWADVLENGPSSRYARFFDVDWNALKSELRNKVLLPVLGDHYGRVLENGDLAVHYEAGAFTVRYFETILPVNPRSYWMLLAPMLPGLIRQLGEEHDAVLELQSIVTGLSHLPPRTETQRAKVIERHREKEILKRRLAALVESTPEAAEALGQSLVRVNGEKGVPRSFDLLDALLEEQSYRLSYWRVAAEEINYRRFFDINDLAAIRMENPEVYAQAHRMLGELLREGRIRGLRIDHPDGLWDPRGYFVRLQRDFFLELCRRRYVQTPGGERTDADFDGLRPFIAERFERLCAQEPRSAAARPLYVAVEKILSRGERLPEDWPVHGTSGYDFAIAVGQLFVDSGAERAISDAYAHFVDSRTDFAELVYQKKKLILRSAMASELNVLSHVLNRLSERDRHSRDYTLGVLTDALREVIACFPVYRTYVTETTEQIAEHDRIAIERAVRQARRRNPTTDASVYLFLRSTLMLQVPGSVKPEDRGLWREFVMRFQQLTGPVMAKGLEDTAFYIYNRLVSLNEVGGEPEHFGTSIATFHQANASRQRSWPYAMITTSTHDTKRSEDARARISVLSELPAAWVDALGGLNRATAAFKTEFEGAPAPDRNEEYLFYQTVLGTLPVEPLGEQALAAYTHRLVEYMRKATKEAKVNTSWINADPEYDAAVESFVRRALASGSPLFEAIGPLAKVIAFHGMWGALSQALLKLVAPGVPDLYQGTELWDFSLVDPDNRRPVDYATRTRALAALRQRGESDRGALARELVGAAVDGRIKLWVTHVALTARRMQPELFGERGEYAGLEAEGPRAEHVVAFARRAGEREILVIAPRLTAKLAGGQLTPPIGEVWRGTHIPANVGSYRDLFTGATITVRDDDSGTLDISRVLNDFPVALLARGW